MLPGEDHAASALSITITPADRAGWLVVEVTYPDGDTAVNELPRDHPILTDMLRATRETLLVTVPDDWTLL